MGFTGIYVNTVEVDLLHEEKSWFISYCHVQKLNFVVNSLVKELELEKSFYGNGTN
jgi:hypothetical protein